MRLMPPRVLASPHALLRLSPRLSLRHSRQLTLLGKLAILVLAPSCWVALAPFEAMGEESADAFRTKMTKWVETRQILSSERSDWIVEKELLESTRDLLRQERDDLRASIKELQEEDAGADEERRQLLLKRADFQRSAEALKLRIRELEQEVLAVAPLLPEPLRDRLELLLVQIPEDPEKTEVALGQRLINVLGVLAQAEKWNSTATFVGETRAVGSGDKKVQVRTLYWGLGQAVYVDNSGEVAGIGRPGVDGWVFDDDPAIASDAKLFLDIYEGNVDTIAFVPVPVDLK